MKNFYIRSLIIIPIGVFQFLIILVNKKWIIKLYSKYYEIATKSLIFNYFLSFGISFVSFFATLNAYISTNKINSYFIISILFIFIIIVFTLIKYIIKSYNLSCINKNILKENELIKELSKKDAVFKHNLINNLLGIEIIANDKTKRIIDDLIRSYKNEYNKINNINELPNGIQGIIYKKVYLKNIENLNLEIENNIKEDIIDLLGIKKYNLFVETIGILIDNALEAVQYCKEKFILIDMKVIDDKLYFEIKNSFDSMIDFDEIGMKNYTTKKSGHGIGLHYLLNNKNLNLNASIVNNLFCICAKFQIKK